MEPIKQFSIFKFPENRGDKFPTHSISAKIGDKYVTIGSCWTKDSTKGGKYLSCQLSKEYNDKPGFHVEVDVPKVESTKTSVGVDGEQIDVSEIPF